MKSLEQKDLRFDSGMNQSSGFSYTVFSYFFEILIDELDCMSLLECRS